MINTCPSCMQGIDLRSSTECEGCKKPMHKDCAINFGGASYCDMCFVNADKEKKDNPFGEFDLPEFIRRTYIETYRTCPYKFYLEVIKGHEQPPNEYTQVGSDVHEIIEDAIENGTMFIKSKEKLDKMFENYSDDLFEYKTRDEMYKRGIESLESFFQIAHTIKNVFAVEETIFTNIGDDLPDVRITMDLITESDGELEMHDWKTGKVMVGKKLSSDLQAPLYIYSVRQKYDKPIRSFTFYYLQENKTRTFVRSNEDPDVYICTVGKREYKVNIIDAIREVKSIFNRIKKGDFNIPTDVKSMYFACKMCHLRKEGLCAGAEEEGWNQVQF